MEKIYSDNSINKLKKLEPNEETVNLILNYSKALSVTKFNNMKFEAVLN